MDRVSLKRARELLAEKGDVVEQSTLSRYVAKYADALDPQRVGRETTVDFEALQLHRQQNINRGGDAPQARAATIAATRGRADESALNIRAQRQMREIELAERTGALTPTRDVEEAASEAVNAMRNASQLALNDTAAIIANVCNVEPRLIRPHLKAFAHKAFDAFVRSLADRQLVAEAVAH